MFLNGIIYSLSRTFRRQLYEESQLLSQAHFSTPCKSISTLSERIRIVVNTGLPALGTPQDWPGLGAVSCMSPVVHVIVRSSCTRMLSVGASA